MLLKLNRDLLNEVLEYVDNLYVMRLVCRELKGVLNNYGYLRKITYGIHTDPIQFIQTYCRFSNSIRNLYVEGVNDPNIFLPAWPKIVNFKNCNMGQSCIDPPVDNTTEILSITDYTRKSLLHVNWAKLPLLRALYIRAWDILFDDMDQCKNLEILCVNLHNTHRYIPEWVGNFPRLNIIIMNMKTDYTYHFISPRLEICLISKKVPFTTFSNWVPRKQLETNMYITMSGWDDEDITQFHSNDIFF